MSREEIIEEKTKEMIDDILNCQTVCADLGKLSIDHNKKGKDKIEQMMTNLPGVNFVRDQMVNFIFSNGMTTGSENQDKRLDDWLFADNLEGITNYSVLREVIGNAICYGEWGLRWYEGCVYAVRSGRYADVLLSRDGITTVYGYVMSKDDRDIDDFDFEELPENGTFEDVLDYFEIRDLIFLPKEDFRNIRNKPNYLHGNSPFNADKLRLKLLLSVYEQLNNDLNNNGPGRIILRPRSGFATGDSENDISANELFSSLDRKAINEKAMKEAKRIAKQIGNSTPDSVIVLSNAFSDKIDKLPKLTKSTEFFDWIENEGVIIAQVLGMSPTLLETGKIHGNVSVEKVIDNAMVNTIIPLRENYSIQFSDMISGKLTLDKIYFNKYDMQQIQDENDVRAKMTGMIKDISYSNKSTPSDNLVNLMDDLVTVMETSLRDENNKLKQLTKTTETGNFEKYLIGREVTV